MIKSEIIKKFIDFYNEFKFDGRLTLEQLVFAMENFQKISFDIEDVIKVINNRTFGEYTQYNAVDFMNAVFNEQVYDLFLKERKEPKMCYWIINIEFYKVFNMYRILVLKTNILMNTVKGALNEVSIKDFERTINIYINDSISNIRKCLDFLRRNKYTEELVFCTRPFRKLLKMDEFGRLMFQRIFPNVDPDEFAKIYETDSDDDDDDGEELTPDVKKKLETVINNLARLDSQYNGQLVDPIKRLVKEALKKAGIDIDLDTNTTFTIGNNIISTSNKNNENDNNNNQDFIQSQAFQNMMSMQNMMQQPQQQNNSKQQNNTQHDINFDPENFKLSKEDEDIDELLRHVASNANKPKTSTTTTIKPSNKPKQLTLSQQVIMKEEAKKKAKEKREQAKALKIQQIEQAKALKAQMEQPTKETRGRKSIKKTA
jgi:hypothetical protein